MVEEVPSLEDFAVTLEKLKLPKTASIFREELEKKNNLQRIEKSLASNPLVNRLMQKLEAPKISKKSQKEESKLAKINILNSKSNLSMLETKIFKKLYDNFDNQKINKTTLSKIMQSNELNDSLMNLNVNANEQSKDKLNSSEMNSKKNKKKRKQ